MKVKVLVVDDEPDFLQMAKFRLEASGYKVFTAACGEDVLNSVKTNTPHMVFLDIKLPGIDGVEALRQLRGYDRDIPVLMITAYGTDERMEETMKLGISGFIPKGSPGQETVETMLTTLKTHKSLTIE